MEPSNKYRVVWYAAVMLLMLGFVLTAQRRRVVTVDSGSRPLMGTLARIVVVAKDSARAAEAIELAFDEIVSLERLMSDFDPNSQLSLVNRRAFTEPVPVDDSLFEVLSASIEYSRLSDGAFDITVGPVVGLWRAERNTGVPPTLQALEEARRAVGWQSLLLDPGKKTVRFAKPGMHLDLGGIAKGYAVDRALELLGQSGAQGAMVDLGGNIRTFGVPAHGARHWNIGLQDPRRNEHTLAVLNLDNLAVATSGDYRRFAVVNGQRLSHIIDPNTAQSAQSVSSVTIIAPSAMQTDALSTAVTVLGDQKGLLLVQSLPQVETIIIKNGAMIKSANAARFIAKTAN
ncbi:MAG: FAD:protein FMN transferase [Planctomycetaceae bacterium]|nr:FAD:protein FMN transferase [Planctomycetaceae bacterium]